MLHLQIDTNNLTVTCEGHEFPLREKVIKVLATLASRPGTLIRRDELLQKCWGPVVAINEEGLTQAIHEIRKALGRDIIVNRHGVGYRLNYDAHIL